MKLSSFGFKGVLHCLGKGADRPQRSLPEPGIVKENPLDKLAGKARSTAGKGTAQRIRRHFIALAEQSMKSAEAGHTEAALLMQAAPGDARWAGKNEAVAKEALDTVRLALYKKKHGSYKSTNKFRVTDPYVEFTRVTSGAFTNFNNFRNITDLRQQHASISKSIWESTSINCDGLARSAVDFISRTHPNIQASTLAIPGHTLAVVGTIEAKSITSPLSEWPSHLYVCDPWANIVCPAPEYPQRFAEKMEKWEADNKKILHNGKWISPTDKTWVSCAKEVPNIATRFAFKNHQFVDMTYVMVPVAPPAANATSAPPNNPSENAPPANR